MLEKTNPVFVKLFDNFLKLSEEEKVTFLQMVFLYLEKKKIFWKVWRLFPFHLEKYFFLLLILFLIFKLTPEKYIPYKMIFYKK